MAGNGTTPAVVVLDIGKTHVRLFAIAPHGREVLGSHQTSSHNVDGAPYLHVDVDRIWAWLTDALADLARRFKIEAIIPCAYGSTAALIDDAGLVLPMMDYEAEPPPDIVRDYAKAAPAFAEGCCPINPGSLTLARQLFWQSRHFPEAFRQTRWILPAAQYWAWRLTGQAATEVTSLGAQTQLWNPRTGMPTDLAEREGWAKRFPQRRYAFDEIGPLNPALAKRAGLEKPPAVLVGIHDSNANYARYLAAGLERFTLVSSGTWLITFDTDLPLDRLQPDRDMVSNTDLEGRPVACTRFMGGREFAEIAGQDGLAASPTIADVETIIGRGTMALPSFTDSGGPFPGTGGRGHIEGPVPETAEEKSALAALYVALATDVDFDLLSSKSNVVIDGSAAGNALFSGLLSALRPRQEVMISRESDGTALGASLLWGWRDRREQVSIELEPVPPLQIPGLDRYKDRWRQQVGETG